MKSTVDVVIVGAGPYGLSIAAHLKARGVDFRIFGRPMETWRLHMPKGMRLKSDGFASSLDDPGAEFPLSKYCEQEGLPYADLGLPIPLETFVSYGLAFQSRFVPGLESRLVVSVKQSSTGFEVLLDNDEMVMAHKVVAAIGLSHYAYIPPVLARLSAHFVSHSSQHREVTRFVKNTVAVVGAGASAADLAALLHQTGATVHLIARQPRIRFHTRGRIPRPLIDRIRRPTTGLGPGWMSFFSVHGPLVFRKFPLALRREVVRKHLGPAAGWFVKDQVLGKVPLHLGMQINGAEVHNEHVRLHLTDVSGARRTLEADHVIAGTGYRVDLRRLTFIDPRIRAAIKTSEHSPTLSSNFESSVSGLYFVGVTAANTFGPLLRFAFGARFASRRISPHLEQSATRPRPGQTKLVAINHINEVGMGSSQDQ